MDWKGQGGYLTHLDFAAMVAADARHCPFSLLTDFMFTRFNAIGSATHIKSVDFAGVSSVPISRSSQTSVGTTLDTTIWTLAGGYTLLQGDWGNLDLLAGFRLLALNARTDFSLALTLTPPHGNGATFGGAGRSISGSQDVWNGIGGIRGNICLGTLRCFVPHYFDIGAGGSQLTWRIAAGLGYQFHWEPCQPVTVTCHSSRRQRADTPYVNGRPAADDKLQLLTGFLISADPGCFQVRNATNSQIRAQGPNG